MSNNQENTSLQSNQKMFEFAFKSWKLLLGIGLVAAILAAVFSSSAFLPPRFTSKAVIYPTNTWKYGNETIVEKMQQYLYSDRIRNAIIEKYNLYEEYDIDKDYFRAPAYMKMAYDEHFSVRETRYQSIEIAVSSTDPEKAKNMAKDIITLVNEIILEFEREKLKEVMFSEKEKMKSFERQMDSIKAVIQDYSSKYGILDFPNQTAEFTEGYMKFLLQSKKGKDFEVVEDMYDNLKNYGYQVYELSKTLEKLNETYAEQALNYHDAYGNYVRELDYTYVIVSPELPTLKSYPIRWLIVSVATLSSMLFTFILLLIFRSTKSK